MHTYASSKTSTISQYKLNKSLFQIGRKKNQKPDCTQNTAARYTGLTYWKPKTQKYSLDLFQEQVPSTTFCSHYPGEITLQLFQCFPQQEATNCSKLVREQLQLKYEIAILEKKTDSISPSPKDV